MLTHHQHDVRPYEVAVRDAKEATRKKLTDTIEAGQGRATQSVADILREFTQREDHLVPARDLDYRVGPKGEISPYWDDATAMRPLRLTDHARGQLLSRLGLPATYADGLAKPAADGASTEWARQLLLHNLQELTAYRLNDAPTLFRVVDQQVKGVLSASYRRMDAAPIIEGFLSRGLELGLVPIAGSVTDTRFHLKMLLPRIFEPVTDEILCFGFAFSTSDYGASAMELSMFLMRLWCTNYAVSESALRRVHLGKRFDNPAEAILLSQHTHDLDAETVTSAVRDVVTGDRLLTWTIEACQAVQSASMRQIDVPTALYGMRKSWGLTKDQTEQADVLYRTLKEPALLPPLDGAWRLSNVLSLMAQSAPGDTALRLEGAAMAVLQ